MQQVLYKQVLFVVMRLDNSELDNNRFAMMPMSSPKSAVSVCKTPHAFAPMPYRAQFDSGTQWPHLNIELHAPGTKKKNTNEFKDIFS